MHIVIFAGGHIRAGRAVDTAIATADLFIAADSGAQTALQYGCTPTAIVGDLDSLALSQQEIAQLGSRLIKAPVEKDETDSELAVQTALEMGASSITLLGALGGERVEHSIANIFLLTGFPELSIRIVDGPSTCWLLRAPAKTTIVGEPGDLLSIFPLTPEARGISTSNLYYPLDHDTLYMGKPRGISNVLTSQQAEVSLEEGMLLVIHTRKHELSS